MPLRAALVLIVFLFGCAAGPAAPESRAPAASAPAAPPPERIGDAPDPSEPVAVPAPAAPEAGSAPSAAPAPDPASAPGARTPADLYAGCAERVEGLQTPGECTADADCARLGCSQEVCAPARLAGDLATTCEVLPCFQVLDRCGCRAGVCAWTLKSEIPGPGGKLPIPTRP